jgi:hypothetical protein
MVAPIIAPISGLDPADPDIADGELQTAHSTSSGHPFHEHPAGHSMNIRPPS